jgi:ribosomal protein S10
VKEQQLSPRPSGDNSNHPHLGTSEDTEEKGIKSTTKQELDDVYSEFANMVAEHNALRKGPATDIKHTYLINTSMTPAATQDSGNEHTMSNSSSSALVQQSSEQQQCEEIDHPPHTTADSA